MVGGNRWNEQDSGVGAARVVGLSDGDEGDVALMYGPTSRWNGEYEVRVKGRAPRASAPNREARALRVSCSCVIRPLISALRVAYSIRGVLRFKLCVTLGILGTLYTS